MLEVNKIAEILEDFCRQYTVAEIDRDFFSDFLIYNDMGIPIAQAVVYGLVNTTVEGNSVILETWVNMCELLGIDPNIDYEDFDDCLDEAELDIDDEED